MNANELIELLEKNAGEGNTPIRQAVTMLRQQQAEIEALKEKLEEWKIWGEEVKPILEKVAQEK